MNEQDLTVQSAILDRLREQVEQAKALFEGAKKEHERALQRMQDLGMTHPDGSILHATKVFNFTLKQYRQSLEEYSQFLIHRKLPDQP